MSEIKRCRGCFEVVFGLYIASQEKQQNFDWHPDPDLYEKKLQKVIFFGHKGLYGTQSTPKIVGGTIYFPIT